VGPTAFGDMVARQGSRFTPPRLDAYRASVGLYSLGGVLALAILVAAFLRRVRPRWMRSVTRRGDSGITVLPGTDGVDAGVTG